MDGAITEPEINLKLKETMSNGKNQNQISNFKNFHPNKIIMLVVFNDEVIVLENTSMGRIMMAGDKLK